MREELNYPQKNKPEENYKEIKKCEFRLWLTILVSVLITAFVAGGGVWVFKEREIQKKVNKVEIKQKEGKETSDIFKNYCTSRGGEIYKKDIQNGVAVESCNFNKGGLSGEYSCEIEEFYYGRCPISECIVPSGCNNAFQKMLSNYGKVNSEIKEIKNSVGGYLENAENIKGEVCQSKIIVAESNTDFASDISYKFWEKLEKEDWHIILHASGVPGESIWASNNSEIVFIDIDYMYLKKEDCDFPDYCQYIDRTSVTVGYGRKY